MIVVLSRHGLLDSIRGVDGNGDFLPFGSGVVGAPVGVILIGVEAGDLEDTYVNLGNIGELGKTLDELLGAGLGVLGGVVDEGELEVAQITEVVGGRTAGDVDTIGEQRGDVARDELDTVDVAGLDGDVLRHLVAEELAADEVAVAVVLALFFLLDVDG